MGLEPTTFCMASEGTGRIGVTESGRFAGISWGGYICPDDRHPGRFLAIPMRSRHLLRKVPGDRHGSTRGHKRHGAARSTRPIPPTALDPAKPSNGRQCAASISSMTRSAATSTSSGSKSSSSASSGYVRMPRLHHDGHACLRAAQTSQCALEAEDPAHHVSPV